ncbi:hypothetical protein EDB84DRAFT_1438943 [Lactarius hengduanensis]|nr:hypothetical protein EDB84DRAFT_1440820 [Lactarius hengduanensis]KAH9031264.1 hypothetical protein EDB84DRAFT_1438943 [Lactarius hengduanensis]
MRRMFQNGDAGDHIMRRGKRGKHIGRQYGVDMNNSEGPTHHRTQSTLLHGDVALGSEAPRFPRNASGDACGMMRRGKRGKKNGSPVLTLWGRGANIYVDPILQPGQPGPEVGKHAVRAQMGPPGHCGFAANIGVPMVGHARPTPHTHDLTGNNKRSAAHRSRNGCGAKRQCGKAERLWGGCKLTRRVCASAAGVVWEVRSAQLYAAVAPVAPGNLSHGDAPVYLDSLAQRVLHAALVWQRTKMYKVKRPCVLTRRTCRRREHGAHVLREAHSENMAESQRKVTVSFLKGCAQRETIHRATAVPSLYATWRYEGADATVRRLKDKCQEPDMVAFGPHTDAKEAGWSERRCTVVHAVVRRVDTKSQAESNISALYQWDIGKDVRGGTTQKGEVLAELPTKEQKGKRSK